MTLSIIIIQAVAFLDLVAVHMIVPSIPPRARKFGATHIQVGLLSSLYAGCQLFSGPILGSLSDVAGRKLVLIFTLLMTSIAYVSFGFTHSIYVILFLRAYLGIFKQTQVLTRAMVPDYEVNERKQSDVYGKMAAASGAGAALGPIIGGHMLENNDDNFKNIAIIVGLVFIFNAAIIWLLPSTTRRTRRNSNTSITGTLKQTFFDLYNVPWSLYGDVFLLKALIGFALSSYYSNYALYLATEFELTAKDIGYMISFHAVIGTIISYFMSYIDSLYKHDKDYSQRNYHVFVIMTLAYFGLAASTNMYCYVLCLIPLAVGNAVGRIVTLEMVLKRSKGKNRGTLIGASNSVRALSGVIAPMIVGYIQYLGTAYVIYMSCAATLLGTLLSYHINRKSLNSRKKND